MEISTIIIIVIILIIALVLLYYFWYIQDDSDNNKREIPMSIIYEDDKTIIDIFKSIADKYPRSNALRVKVTNKWKDITYSEYYNHCENFSQKLLYYVGPHARVAILSFNRPEWFYIHIGTMMACGVSVGIYPTASPGNCSFIVNHSCVDLLVIEDEKQMEKLKDIKISTVKLILTLNHIDNDELLENIKSNNPHLEIISYDRFVTSSIGSPNLNTTIEMTGPFIEDTATIIYTSGTTGDPKGVVITHKNIMASIKNGLYVIQSKSNISLYIQESFISYLPLNHIAAQMMDLYVPLVSVGCVSFADRDALKGSLKDILKEIRPTVFIGVPRVWEKIMEKIKEHKKDPNSMINKVFFNKLIVKEIGLDRAKYCISAAAPVSKETRDFFSALGIELCDVYGMSETSGPISMGVPGCSKGAGVPLLSIKIDKETSEIMVKGDNVTKQYYKNAKATEELFYKRDWLKTGDTGYIDRDGCLYVTGRIKDLIVTAGGENISPIPIETELLKELNTEHTLFDYAVVVGDKRKFLSVLLVPNPKNKYDKLESSAKKQIDGKIQKAIDATNKKAPNKPSYVQKFKVLNTTFEIGELLTPTLKVRRKNVIDKFEKEIDQIYANADD